MLSIKLMNIHSNMFALTNYSIISPVITPIAPPVTPLDLVISTLFVLAAFIEHENLVLETTGLPIGSHVTTENANIILIYDQPFTFWREA